MNDVAVIIVNWNGGELLQRCLASLERQTLHPRRVIVVDNASSDGSAERIVRDYPDVMVMALGRNSGFAEANNIGVKAATDCKWVALLNADAFPEPPWLDRLRTAAERFPEYSFFGSRMLMDAFPDRLDGVGDVYHAFGFPWREGRGRPAHGRYEKAQEIFSPCAAAALYRRDVYLEAGGFDEDYFCYLEDVDLGFRLRLAGCRCLYIPDSVVRHVGSGLTGKKSALATYLGQRNMVWTFVKNFPAPWIWLFLIPHVFLNVFAIAWCAFRGDFAVVIKAKRDALLGLGQVFKKRRAIQRSRRIGFATLRPMLVFGLLRPLFRWIREYSGTR